MTRRGPHQARLGNYVRKAAALVATAALGVGVLILAAEAAPPCRAASVPAWLDAAISKWNGEHPDAPIRFVNIKDSFVWYDMPKTADIGQQQIRERVNTIVLANNYVPMDEEELVTTGKPPVTSGRSTPKKCWSRSFVLNIQSQSNTKAVGDESPGQRQRMLTSLICDDASTWWAAFRVAE